jgi:two-component system response regulator MtrA
VYNIRTRRDDSSKEDLAKDSSAQHVELTFEHMNGQPVPMVFIICDQRDTAPVWGYILRQEGLIVVLETSGEQAVDRWSITPDLLVIDIDVPHQDPMELCRKFRAVSVTPILLFLPTHDETLILEAYAAGVDEVVIKPIGPAIFLAKTMAWVRRSWIMPVDGLSLIKAGRYKLNPKRRCVLDPDELEIQLTNLEFLLLHLLMSCPGHIFSAEEIVQSIWGGYGISDQVLLKNVVYRLRRKIEADPSHPLLLLTGPGGYSFQG